MTQMEFSPDRIRRIFLLALVIAVSVLFLAMISRFLIPLLLAAITCGLTRSLYVWLVRRLKGREVVASVAAVLVILLLIIGPLMGLAGIVTAQALRVSEAVRPSLEGLGDMNFDLMSYVPDWVPFREAIESNQGNLIAGLKSSAASAGTFLVQKLSAMAKGTAGFFFDLFIMLYAMFFFYVHGVKLMERVTYYIPLPGKEKGLLMRKFLSVSRATLKGTMIIGALQGVLGGIGIAVAGIHGAAFWGTVMGVLSIVPGIGIAVVWGPVAIYLLLTGKTAAGIGLAVYCGLFVGMVDNFLRPRLVSKEAELPDLMIFLGMFGGLIMFGATGLVIGPIVAALFVTLWEFYGNTFRDVLSEQRPAGGGP